MKQPRFDPLLRRVLIGLAVLSLAAGSRVHPISVIVHPSNSVRHIPRIQLEDIYRRYRRRWSDGTPIVAVHARFDSALRRRFRRRVLRASAESLAVFWNRRYFEGIRPPLVLGSARAIRAFVARTPTAIGYIPSRMVDDSVKVIRELDGR